MTVREDVEKLRNRIERKGYYLNPDLGMTEPLVEGLLVNQARYGYAFCPCRLASGVYTQDVDLICPCNYRDQDVNEYGSCYCGLYVSREVAMEKKTIESIPERKGEPPTVNRLWRCNVCGYICSRPHPPDVCPICGVTHDRFEEFTF
jgi:ferredoxin-thioredoxin reductase catalytic subunit